MTNHQEKIQLASKCRNESHMGTRIPMCAECVFEALADAVAEAERRGAEAEREACVKVASDVSRNLDMDADFSQGPEIPPRFRRMASGAQLVANAIRARGQTKE